MLPLDQQAIIAILAAFVANVTLGMFWYSPYGFGRQWMKLMKINPNAKPDGMAKAFSIGFGGSLFGVYMLLWLLQLLPSGSVTEAMMAGFLLWLGINVPQQLNQLAWENRPLKLVLINSAHLLVSILLSSAILVSLA